MQGPMDIAAPLNESAQSGLRELSTEAQLRETIKELHCLAEITRLVAHAGTVEDLLGKAVLLLPAALQFPEDAVARILFQDQIFQAGTLEKSARVRLWRETERLRVEVGYRVEHPFLPAESQLLETVCERLEHFVLRLQSEQALRLNEQRYRLLADNTLDVIWALNLDLEFTYVNAAVTALTGFSPEEYVGSRVQEHSSEADVTRMQRAISQALAEGEQHQGTILEFAVSHRQGHSIPVECHARVLFDECGQPIGFQGTSRDIRERRETLAALRESEEQYRTMFETMAQGAVFQNSLGEITSANPAAERILGLSLEEMKGRLNQDARWGAVREDGSHFPGEEHPAMVALRTGREVRDVIMGVFNPREHAYRWVQIHAAPQFRPDLSTPYQIYATFEDVTELRRAQAERQAADRMTAELLESIRDGFFGLDQDLIVTYMNRAAETLLKRHRDEVVGRSLLEAFPEARESIFEEKYREALAQGKQLDFETYFEPHQDWYDVRVYPHENGISVFFQVVTDRKKIETARRDMESQLRQAQKLEAVGRLAGGVAHDFNNMLSVILGNVELALQSIPPVHPAFQDLNEIANAARRSASLTRQLLAFARKQTVAPQMLNLNKTVQGTLSMLKRLVREDIELAWKPQAGLPAVNMDPSQVDQLITNLVVNARDAIEGVGSIVVETWWTDLNAEQCRHRHGIKPGRYVVLSVKDTGCGMNQDILDNLFEPFFTTKSEACGTGLGLSTVHGIVQQNDGLVEVSSTVSVGTTFRIYLPAANGTGETSGDPDHTDRVGKGTETVLLVEDEPSLLRLTERVLKGLGYQVHTAQSPEAALQLCQDEGMTFDLLLTDVVLPGMNGRELYEALEQLYPGLKCLFMSGYTSDALANRKGVLDDQVHFLQKPFSRQQLADKLRAALESCARPRSPATS